MQSQQPDWGQPPGDNGPRCTLSAHERTRLSQAASDLDEARRADLTQLDAASLVRTVERLRSSLDDMVQLVNGISS